MANGRNAFSRNPDKAFCSKNSGGLCLLSPKKISIQSHELAPV
jgi:hypothetical protein